MEGVMMRGQKNLATVVRRPDGTLAKQVKPLSTIYTGRFRRIPFTRGVIVLLESLVLGTQSLMYSASVALDDEEQSNATKPAAGNKGTDIAIWIIILISLALAVGLFFLSPLFLTRLILPNNVSSLLFHFTEGAVRLVIFLTYLSLVGFMPDIRRVFAYHGAEHKAIHAYEAGAPLRPENVQTFTTAHARCGTAFLLAVMLIAILVFSLIGKPVLWLMVASRILFVPIIAAIAYELTQFGARHLSNPIVRIAIAPGMRLQRLTTRQPDDKMVEVSIAALEAVLIADGVLKKAEPDPTDLPA